MNDRQEKIYMLLCKQGSISMDQLKNEIFASEATLRRDLSKMEQEGLLKRTWGGAVASGGKNSDPPFFLRSNTNVAEKNSISKLAVEFMENNMTVFLASGTTVTRLAKRFYKYSNLTVITNGLDVADALKNHPSAKVIILGGELYENYDLVGSLTENAIDSFNADIFFFSCSGITAQGFTSLDMARLEVIKKMKNNSSKTVLLTDNSKVGKKYSYNGFGFECIDHVVMDAMPSDAELRRVLGRKMIVPKSV